MAIKLNLSKRSDPESDDGESLPLDQQETISDLNIVPNWYFGAVLWSTDWTAQTIISQLDRGNINLSPRFQRRNAWNADRKSLFIESLILGLPIPQIILAEDRKRKGSFIVIDGKQRLLSLRQFVSKDEDGPFARLKLSGLSDRTDLNGKTFADLQADPNLSDELNTFENQTIRTVVIRNWEDEKYLYSVFLRINTGSVQLSPQELRQALHPGPFTDFIDDFSADSEELKSVLRLKHPDFRMRDVELVLRYFAYKFFAGQYSGNLKEFLDDTVLTLNGFWNDHSEEVHESGARLGSALTVTRKIFGIRGELRKWNGQEYERRINRAVFDIMTYYFSIPEVAEAALTHAEQIKSAFERLCVQQQDFRTSLETTTKSMEANQRRFGIWATALSEILGQQIQSPL